MERFVEDGWIVRLVNGALSLNTIVMLFACLVSRQARTLVTAIYCNSSKATTKSQVGSKA